MTRSLSPMSSLHHFRIYVWLLWALSLSRYFSYYYTSTWCYLHRPLWQWRRCATLIRDIHWQLSSHKFFSLYYTLVQRAWIYRGNRADMHPANIVPQLYYFWSSSRSSPSSNGLHTCQRRIATVFTRLRLALPLACLIKQLIIVSIINLQFLVYMSLLLLL